MGGPKTKGWTYPAREGTYLPARLYGRSYACYYFLFTSFNFKNLWNFLEKLMSPNVKIIL